MQKRFGFFAVAFFLATNAFTLAEPPENWSSEKVTVYNSGIGGNNSADLLRRLDRAMAKKPTLTVLLVGSNDMLNSNKLIPLDQYEKNLRQLVKQIQKSGSQVLLMTAPPCYEPYLFQRHKKEIYGKDGPNGRILKLNQTIQRVANDMKLPVVDLHKKFTKIGKIGEGKKSRMLNLANSGKADGVHPTAEGHRMIAKAVHDVIVQEKLKTDRIVCLGDSITYGAHMKGAGTTMGETYPAFLVRLFRPPAKEL